MNKCKHNNPDDLSHTLLSIDSKEKMEDFLHDLCTPSELKALMERWNVCQLLATNELSYRGINAITGASLTTIGRVARFLRTESNGGYRDILANREEENDPIIR